MKRKLSVLAAEDDLNVGLAFHEVPASLLTEFAEKIAEPFYRGNIANAIKDLMQQAIAEREFVLSHIKYVKSEGNG
jgi:gamma-glutamyltranspeptidase